MTTAAHMAEAGRQRRHNVARAMRGLRVVLDTLPADQVADLAARIETLVPPEAGQGRVDTAQAEAVDREIAAALHAFAVKERLLDGALTAPAVARLLGVSRQTPHDRVRAGTLLAVLDRGVWRFPVWQFDASAPGGVLPGLAPVLQALDGLPPLSKISWFVSPKALLPDTPLALLRRGRPADLQEVVLAAQSAVML